MRLLRTLLLFLALVPHGAHAAFHLWTMNELYSNADGTVQFLELTALTSGQQFMAGHTLSSSSGGQTNTLRFDHNLPGDTSGRRMLIGTQGFAALGVVTPDYVVPNGFFFTAGGRIDFAEGSDVWNHGALPTDGSLALGRNGSTATNSPRNFAGQAGTVTPPPPPQTTFNIQGLWYASPAESEAGWGVNITQQGDIAFATWFTYDQDGSGMWLVMSNGARTAANTWTGALYRTTGPAFSANPFNPAQVTVTPVGSATFDFSDANNGTFNYTVNGITQTKPITRQIFATPTPTCTLGGSAGSTPNYQDLWWRSPANSESGWGVNIAHQGNILFATWFTYDANGRGLWLVMSAGLQTGANTFAGDLYRTTGPAFNAVPWDKTRVTVTRVGSATFTFTDAANGTFAYTVDGVSQSKPITRQVYSTPVTVCR